MLLADFQKRIAQRLAVVPVTGTLSAEDAELIQGAYESLLMELGSHNLAWWNADELVPDEFADCLVGMVAAAVVDDFTIPEPRRSQLIAEVAFGLAPATFGERRLRALTRAASSGEAAEAEYF